MGLAKKKKETPCDRGEHQMFDTLGGDQLCALGCGRRLKGAASDLLSKEEKRRKLAEEGNDTALLAMLEGRDDVDS